ncbi:MAG: VOC family protein [Hyphomicrobiaceae bacterium]
MATFSFDHIHLRSPDPEATATFYAKMVDAGIVRSAPNGQPRIDIKLGGANIFVAPVPPDQGAAAPPESSYQGLDHFGLEVSGIDGKFAELKDEGAAFTMEPTTIRPGTRTAFLRGPEGVSIELLERTPA